ncbi:YodC family protein [Kalamiella sp. sgz302252]|uniref:YodC family protein n=1 Tax=Pantoea sp. sgz302252 TaxID=3341827 RepID=UPI0036D2F60A
MILVSDAVQLKEGGPAMVVTGHASGMVECRWYDGYSVRREAFREEELCALAKQTQLAS